MIDRQTMYNPTGIKTVSPLVNLENKQIEA